MGLPLSCRVRLVEVDCYLLTPNGFLQVGSRFHFTDYSYTLMIEQSIARGLQHKCISLNLSC